MSLTTTLKRKLMNLLHSIPTPFLEILSINSFFHLLDKVSFPQDVKRSGGDSSAESTGDVMNSSTGRR